MKILLIEDSQGIAAHIQKSFNDAGHSCDHVTDGKVGLIQATTGSYDLLIVDRLLPSIDGLTIVKTLRATQTQIPIIILSALGEVDDRVKGLRTGSDDYVVKPFAFSELLARCEILHHRFQSSFKEAEVPIELTAGDLTLNLLSREVSRQNIKIELQTTEFKLLEFLLRNRGRIVTRTMLLEYVWDYHFDPQTNVIDVHISRLRNKIDRNFPSSIIKTIRGAGYTIELD